MDGQEPKQRKKEKCDKRWDKAQVIILEACGRFVWLADKKRLEV